jgi:hypothetical protein
MGTASGRLDRIHDVPLDSIEVRAIVTYRDLSTLAVDSTESQG